MLADANRILRPCIQGIPLATGGERIRTLRFIWLIEGGVVDIAQPDCRRCGGLRATLCVAANEAEQDRLFKSTRRGIRSLTICSLMVRESWTDGPCCRAGRDWGSS